MSEQDTQETTEDTSELDALKAELASLKSQLQDAKAEAIDRRKQLDLWKKLGESPDKVQEKLSEAAKGKNPEHEAVIAQLKEAHQREISALTGTLANERKSITTERLKAELAKKGFIPDALDSIATLAAAQIEHTDDGIRIMADGKPMIGSAADGGATLADLAASLASKHTYALVDQGKGGGGTPGKNGGTPTNTKPIKEWGPAEKGAFIREHGLDAWKQKLQAQS